MSVQTNIRGESGKSADVDELNRLKVTGGFLDGFGISDRDVDLDPKYWGYEDPEGNWRIQRQNWGTGTYRYTSGTSDYPTAWTNRASQIYNYISVEF